MRHTCEGELTNDRKNGDSNCDSSLVKGGKQRMTTHVVVYVGDGVIHQVEAFKTAEGAEELFCKVWSALLSGKTRLTW